MEHSSVNVITYCVNEGRGDRIGVGCRCFKKLYDVESLFFGSIILLWMRHILSASFNTVYIQATGCATVSVHPLHLTNFLLRARVDSTQRIVILYSVCFSLLS